MSFHFRPAKRQDAPLLIGIAGPTGSGKTLSALRLAKGMSGGKPFALIDTERGRALHYADFFTFLHCDLEAPFTPARYDEAIEAATKSDHGSASMCPPVIVVDSFSHEHAGEGGLLDMHEAELQRMAGDDYKRRDAMKFSAWIKPKAEHKRLISHLLQLPCHLIVCLRAEEKIDIVKENGKTVVVPKRTLAGHVGWIPICGKDLPFELTLSLVVTPDEPGVPKPIKLQKQHRPLVPLDQPLDERVGARLAEWARGSGPGPRDPLPGTEAGPEDLARVGVGDLAVTSTAERGDSGEDSAATLGAADDAGTSESRLVRQPAAEEDGQTSLTVPDEVRQQMAAKGA